MDETEGMHGSFQINVIICFGYIPRSGIAGSCGHIVVPLLTFWATAILFSIVAAPVHIPTNSAQGFPLLHMFFYHFSCLVFLFKVILTDMRWYFICISLMISNVEVLFTWTPMFIPLYTITRVWKQLVSIDRLMNKEGVRCTHTYTHTWNITQP